MLWPLSWDDSNWRSMTHTWGGIINLLPLSWDDDNWRSMFHTLGIYNHALLSWGDDNWRSIFHTWMIYNHALYVVMRSWQLTKHESYFRDKLPCSDRCHETMTTDGACFLPEEYISMLRRLAWDLWQLTEHVSYMNDILQCSDLLH